MIPSPPIPWCHTDIMSGTRRRAALGHTDIMSGTCALLIRALRKDQIRRAEAMTKVEVSIAHSSGPYIHAQVVHGRQLVKMEASPAHCVVLPTPARISSL